MRPLAIASLLALLAATLSGCPTQSKRSSPSEPYTHGVSSDDDGGSSSSGGSHTHSVSGSVD